jgi:hypothetical protein
VPRHVGYLGPQLCRYEFLRVNRSLAALWLGVCGVSWRYHTGFMVWDWSVVLVFYFGEFAAWRKER